MREEDLLARSARLDEQIAGSVAVHDLARAGRRYLLLIRILAVSLAFDIVLSIALGLVAFRAQETATAARSIEDRAYTTCLSGNETRAAERQLWGYILALPPTTSPTPEQQKQRADFQIYIARLFAPRTCTR